MEQKYNLLVLEDISKRLDKDRKDSWYFFEDKPYSTKDILDGLKNQTELGDDFYRCRLEINFISFKKRKVKGSLLIDAINSEIKRLGITSETIYGNI